MYVRIYVMILKTWMKLTNENNDGDALTAIPSLVSFVNFFLIIAQQVLIYRNECNCNTIISIKPARWLEQYIYVMRLFFTMVSMIMIGHLSWDVEVATEQLRHLFLHRYYGFYIVYSWLLFGYLVRCIVMMGAYCDVPHHCCQWYIIDKSRSVFGTSIY
jgi:hypothetical protein